MKTIVVSIAILSFFLCVFDNLFAQTATPTMALTPIPLPIRYVSLLGSNSNSGGSTDPWRTLTHACKTAPIYTDIIVREGTYVYSSSHKSVVI